MALKAGYQHQDCAEMYENEDSVGRALKELQFEEGSCFLDEEGGISGPTSWS